MIDLTIATNCIRVQKENGAYRGAKIGRVAQDFYGMGVEYKIGQIVLFREELYPDVLKCAWGNIGEWSKNQQVL